MADDIDEFIKQNLPRGKRSRLYPHLPNIRRLRSEGFSFEQVCAYLATKGVVISASGLASYLKRQEVDHKVSDTQGPRQAAFGPAAAQEGGAASSDEQSTNEDEAHADDDRLSPTSRRERRERVASKYINSETSNPLLRKLQEKKQ